MLSKLSRVICSTSEKARADHLYLYSLILEKRAVPVKRRFFLINFFSKHCRAIIY